MNQEHLASAKEAQADRRLEKGTSNAKPIARLVHEELKDTHKTIQYKKLNKEQ